jgi:uncharacterized membrane protein HdeD (DUF308 family)
VATTASAISDKTLPGRTFEIFLGIVSLIAGVVMLVWSFESLVILAKVVGLWSFFIGLFEIGMAFVIRNESKALSA